jgi:predicted RNA polymerase sigma factor
VPVEATAERRLRFEDFYWAERATLIGAVVFALGDADLGIEASDEALVRAYERWTDVAAMSNPMGWVYRVAVNVGYKRTRRLALERRRPLPHGRDAVDLEGLSTPR